MTSSAILSRKPKASFVALGCLAAVAVLGAGSSRAREAAASSSEAVAAASAAAVTKDRVHQISNPFSDHFPNVVLRTHEGRNVRFYDDLLKDKIVLINFMYATCTER